MAVTPQINAAFVAAQESQTVYWRALSTLEKALGFEIDGTQDLNDLTLTDLVEAEKGSEHSHRMIRTKLKKSTSPA